MKKQILTIAAFALAVALLLGGTLFLVNRGDVPTTVAHDTEQYPASPEHPVSPASPVLPALHITSDYDPFTVERNFWHDGTLTLSDTAEEYAFSDVDIRIRGRGNSTWLRGADKRPLRIRFAEDRPFFDSGYAHRDWILLANHFDAALLRNYTALYLASQLDNLDFTPFSRHVHLYVNGEYMGVYQLTDERDIGSGRLPLTFDPDPAVSEYLFELDGHLVGWLAEGNVEGEDFFTVDGMAYDIRFPNDDDWDGHLEYLQAFVQRVSDTIHSRDFAAVEALIDLPSLVDFYLVQEVTKNADVGMFSVFMTLRGQGDDRRLHFGPVWDFDRSIGNMLDWPEPEDIYAAFQNDWFATLLDIPEIFDLVAARWNEIRDTAISGTIAHVRDTAERYEADFQRNFERHPHILGRPHRPTPDKLWRIDSFMGHVEYMTTWLETRVEWLDNFFNQRPNAPTGWFSERHDRHWALVQYHTYGYPVTMVIDGIVRDFHPSPILLDGRAMVPLHEIASVFGLITDLNPETEVLTITRDATTITHTIGADVFTVNGADVESDSAVVIRDYVYVPLRTIVDALGYQVEWHSDDHTIEIIRH
ncbi:MAG: CotH kinase family protein [Oscillospiraceae bacterium]|nr:CotH kinase family protein [Oscillospiraceae bacterium]